MWISLDNEHLERNLHKMTCKLLKLDEEHASLLFQQKIILENMLRGIYFDKENILKNLKELNLIYLNNYIRVAVCSYNITYERNIHQVLQQLLCERISKIKKNNLLLFLLQDSSVIIFLSNTKCIPSNEVLNSLNSFVRTIKERLNMPYDTGNLFTIGVGNQYKGIEKISCSYKEAVCANNCRYFKGEGSIIFFQDINRKSGSIIEEQEIQELVDNLIKNIFMSNPDKVISMVYSFFSAIEQAYMFSVNDIQMKCIEVIFLVDFNMKDKGVELKSLNKLNAIDNIRSFKTFDTLKLWFKDKMLEFTREIKSINQDGASCYINKAKKYVEDNYADKISIEDIANYLHINSNYFSGMFKKIPGQNFTDYVNQVRIHSAKDLISKSTYKIKEIAGMVGYNNISYFCTVFKKSTGVSPLKYK